MSKEAPYTGSWRIMRSFLFGGALAISSLSSPAALACAFDMVKPERTQIDWIVEAERLVLARSGAANAFAYDVTSVLAGAEEGPPIGALVDSTTRRKLASNPTDAVLFAFSLEGGWRRVAYIDEGWRSILDTALKHRSDWQAGMTQSRLEFISSLQESKIPAHEKLVIGELDKVPYPQLREMDLRIPSEDLLAQLWTREGVPYQAILALLLGLSGTPEARAEIQDYITRVSSWDWANNLGAFAAAYIELEGVEGVQNLDQRFLNDPSQPLDKLEQIVMAMSVHHGLKDPQLRTAIHQSIGRLVESRPDAGALVARQFSLRSDWSQAAQLEPLVRDRRIAKLEDMLTVSVYLGRAREAAALAEGATDG